MRFVPSRRGRLVRWLTAQSHGDKLKRPPLGHLQTSPFVAGMSALTPNADIVGAVRHIG
jgi:hypothetical protein